MRNLFHRAQIAPVKAYARPECLCAHRWAAHEDRGEHQRGRCGRPRCRCLGYRPADRP